jgi:hypothetical protein
VLGNKFSTVFWPLLMIILGGLWLLANLELIDPQVLRSFVNLWPLLLIAVGIQLLLRSSYPPLGPWIALGVLVLAIAIAVAAPGLGWNMSPELKEVHYSEPLDEAESAQITLDLSIGTSTISAGERGGALIEADISYYKSTALDIEGEGHKTAKLTIDNEGVNVMPFSFLGDFIGLEPQSEVRLTPDIPINLVINEVVGEVDIDLSGLQLTSLVVRGGVGDMRIVLPGQSEPYTAKIDGGVGRVRVEVQEGANVQLDISGGVGDFSIDLPQDAPVRLDGDADVGNIKVPSFMNLVTERERSVGRSGIWESGAYSTAEARIDIEFNGGVGSLTLR